MVFFGTLSLFSYAVLSELLNLKANIHAIVLAKNAPEKIQTRENVQFGLIQTFKHKTIEVLALEQNIPIIYVQNIHDPQFFAQIKAYEADFFVVACFPYLIPRSLWELPKLTSLNVHPSLLPEFRGPAPVFWQLRAGNEDFGITIHQLNQFFDQGKILLQKKVSLKDGMRGRAIDRLFGKIAAKMLVCLAANYSPTSNNATANSKHNSSYYPIPQASDFTIALTWSAKHSFNFMRGTEEWDFPYPIALTNRQFLLSRALAYSPAGKQTSLYKIEADIIMIQFAQGLLQAKLFDR